VLDGGEGGAGAVFDGDIAAREDPRFYLAIGVPVADVVPFREATTRHNAAYWVVAYPRGEEEAEVSRLVEEREARYPPPSQIVVYCKTVEQAKGMAEVLRCSVYHRHVGDTAMKKTTLLRLTRHMDRWPGRVGCEGGEERCDVCQGAPCGSARE